MIEILQLLAALVFAMVAGSVFGIWQGYDPTTYTAATFLEMHQGAVRGLNTLLPAMAFISILLTVSLAWFARGKGGTLWLYLAAILLMVAGGVVTRFFNQPINASVMAWKFDTMPDSWEELRDAWWRWHLVRTGLSIGALALLLIAILSDRDVAR